MEIYLIILKCYTAPRYIHLIWNINIWKVPKCWCRHFWHLCLWLVKVKVIIQSFLLHLSRSVYFVTYLTTLKCSCQLCRLSLSSNKLHSVNPPPSPFCSWEGSWVSYQIFKKGRLDRISVLRSEDLRGWLLGKREVVFSAGLQFLHKKVYEKMFLSVITKNLNWEILT